MKAASQRDICTSIFLAVHSNIICNHQNVKATQVSNYGWIEKQNVVYTYRGILFILKKKGESDTCFSMNESWKHYAKWNSQSPKDKRLLYEVFCTPGPNLPVTPGISWLVTFASSPVMKRTYFLGNSFRRYYRSP